MQLRHRNPLAGRPYVRSDKYQLVSQVVLQLLPETGPGRTSEELVADLARALPLSLFPTFASIRWFLTAVRIDLEARGAIRRAGRQKPVRYLAAPDGARPAEEESAPSIVIGDWSGPVTAYHR